jgi:peptide chain release factor 3
LEDPELHDIIGEIFYNKLLEDIEVLDMLIPAPDLVRIEAGDQSPLFFGSAMTNFGVELFLTTFLRYTRYPMAREATIIGLSDAVSDDEQQEESSLDKEEEDDLLEEKEQSLSHNSQDTNGGTTIKVQPDFDEFTGFVFKLQANLDPKHRDRMAFIRICSGVYRKGMKVSHHRLKKSISLSSAQSLFAQERESITEAYPGDIIGIHNPGYFSIGDTIYTGTKKIVYPGIPSFSPEKFAYIRNPNPSTYKKFQKGLTELLDEGAVQMLRDRNDDGNGSPLLAAVGQLQFEVI